MNNTEKKLDALIEALGFDCEKIITHNETPISNQSGMARIELIRCGRVVEDLVIVSGKYKQGDDECYYIANDPVIDYKVTKKDSVNNDKLSSFLRYLSSRLSPESYNHIVMDWNSNDNT